MEYKHSTFQLGLQGRNVNKSEKTTDSTALFISKPVKCRQQREDDKRKGKRRKEIRKQKCREEKKRKEKKR